jgi:hypothetical protein
MELMKSYICEYANENVLNITILDDQQIDGAEVVILTRRQAALYPKTISGTHFFRGSTKPKAHNVSEKNAISFIKVEELTESEKRLSAG